MIGGGLLLAVALGLLAARATPRRLAPPRTGGPAAAAGPADDGAPPALAPGVELLGAFRDAGYADPRFLARLADGRMVGMTRLTHAVATHIDGRRTYEEIAARASADIGRRMGADGARFLVRERLRPVGVVAGPPSPAFAPPRRCCRSWRGPPSSPPAPSASRRRHCATSSRRPSWRSSWPRGWRSTSGWSRSTASGAGGGDRPPAGAHARHPRADDRLGGVPRARPRRRLPVRRRHAGLGGRRRVPDLAGLLQRHHRQLPARPGGPPPDRPRRPLLQRRRILAVAGVYAATGVEPLLAFILLQQLQMLLQFMPWVRLDGYYVVSDLAGVPNLFAHIAPALQGLLPGRGAVPRARRLTRRAGAIVRAWVVTAVLSLAAVLVLLAVHAPEAFRTAATSARERSGAAAAAAGAGDLATAAWALVQLAMLVLPAVGLAAVAALVLRRLAGVAATRAPRLPRVALVALACFAAGLVLPLAIDSLPV